MLKGHKQTEETKRKISLATKGKPKPWLKGKNQWINFPHPRGMLDKTAWNKGIKTGLIPKSAFKKGHIPWRKDNPVSEETKEKLSIFFRGKTSWMKGKKHSEEAIEKIRQARLKQIVPNKDTSIELKIQDLLRNQGIIFETNYPILGQPDIFIKPNICIFADGCYWHKCPECGFNDLIKNEKDQRITQELQKQGYTVVRLWEHEIKNMTTLSI